MTKYLFPLLLVALLAGCKSIGGKQVEGSELVQDANGRSRFVTYVTPEEFERMTPEERQRLHAEMGSSVSIPLPGTKAPSEAISEDDFKKAYPKEK